MTILATRPASLPTGGPPLQPAQVNGQLPEWSGRSWLRPALVEWLVTLADGLLIFVCGVGCTVAYHLSMQSTLGKTDIYAAASLMVAINFGLLVTVQKGYELTAITDLPRQLRITLTTWTGVFAALLAIAFTMKVSEEFSRGTTISFYLVGLIALSLWKTVAARWTRRALREGAFANSRVVVIAEQGLQATSAAMLELCQHGYRLMRVFEIRSSELASPLLMSSIGPRFDELVAYAREQRIEHVFLLMNWSRQHAIDSLLDGLKILPIPVHLVPDANVSRFLKYPQVHSGSAWTAELRRAPLSWKERAVKRALDLAGASLALIVFAPIMLFTALLIKCTSRGPVFFRQTRNGFGGRAFRIFKFRTMRVLEDGPTIRQATKNDPRVTPIGKWLRRTSIDELPQLFNVLKGDMSLVGPRPHAAAHNSEYEQIIGNYAFRHHVKPGITGWAQVNGYRGETRTVGMMEKRVEYDLWYINNWTVWLDLRILLGTLMVTFTRPTAH
ncbi:undecaprenyl-phosphate glucose phosphotransferase [Bradyrhizobium sp. Arg237L]|uniref:undecaprenyl-phosphate glucose phosphotransferase n=1 Tax=Bradyrhizobium sp. Arg237L TaxID=3003352 RepID=UPI00249E0AFC|nr:undecaprenyl-phosphate glucose phosphotransferase [Bradyrhizobium sp. Arg237L]MDI4238194.1 undecaprenyl-phosphate glucose phosphotransferase [Bradyrhizobium sp. Arg237L]